MKKRQRLLTDKQWKLIEPLLPKAKRRRDKRGRPPAPNQAAWRALWVLQTGAAWRFLPDEFPFALDVLAAVQQWQEQGVWLNAWRTLLGTLDERVCSSGTGTFLDGSFAPAKKGAPQSAKPSVARGRSGWYWSTVKVFRWEFVESASPVKLILRRPQSPKSASPRPHGRPRQSRSA